MQRGQTIFDQAPSAAHFALFSKQNDTCKRLALALLISFLCLGFFTQARAEYSFCNKSSYAITASIGYVEEGRMITRGWWPLRAGECKVVITDNIQPGRYFVYAEAIPGHRGPLRVWSGDTPLCVENENLFTLRDQDICREDPRRQRDFFTVEVTKDNEGTWKTEFLDERNFDVYKAEVAGVQRLLKDVGMTVKNIDGNLGRATQLALRAYRSSKSLGDSALYDDALIDTLIQDANDRDNKIGFFFCNATEFPIWGALGAADEDHSYASSGWWKMEGSECAKVVRGDLTSKRYYVYAVMDLGDKDVPLVGGEKTFCVSNVQFDAQADLKCKEEGYDEVQFRRVDIGSKKTFTYQFSPDQFNPEFAVPKPTRQTNGEINGEIDPTDDAGN